MLSTLAIKVEPCALCSYYVLLQNIKMISSSILPFYLKKKMSKLLTCSQSFKLQIFDSLTPKSQRNFNTQFILSLWKFKLKKKPNLIYTRHPWMRLQNQLLDSKFTHSQKKNLWHRVKSYVYTIWLRDCRSPTSATSSSFGVWVVVVGKGAAGSSCHPQHCQLYMCLLFCCGITSLDTPSQSKYLHSN